MRIPVRIIADGCRVGLNMFFGMTLDLFLLSVFWSHLRQAIAMQRYRPVYRRSGRRNRVRF